MTRGRKSAGGSGPSGGGPSGGGTEGQIRAEILRTINQEYISGFFNKELVDILLSNETAVIKGDVSKLMDKLTTVETQLGKIEVLVNENKKNLEGRIQKIEKDVDEFKRLTTTGVSSAEIRIESLESAVAALETKVKGLPAQLKGSSSVQEEDKQSLKDLKEQITSLYNEEMGLQDRLDKCVALAVSVMTLFLAFEAIIFQKTTATPLDFYLLVGLVLIVAVGLGFLFLLIWNQMDSISERIIGVQSKYDKLTTESSKVEKAIQDRRKQKNSRRDERSIENEAAEIESIPGQEITEPREESRLEIIPESSDEEEDVEEDETTPLVNSLARIAKLRPELTNFRQRSYKLFLISLGVFIALFSIYLVMLQYIRQGSSSSSCSCTPALAPASCPI